MRIVCIKSEQDQAEFAKAAAAFFCENPKCFTYAKGDPSPGSLLAVRWNGYTVIVLKLDADHIPSLYPVQYLIGRDLPTLQPSYAS